MPSSAQSLSNSCSLVAARLRSPLAQAEQPVGELLPVVGQDGANVDRASALQVAQEPPGIGRGLGLENADEDPAGGTVDGDEQIAA